MIRSVGAGAGVAPGVAVGGGVAVVAGVAVAFGLGVGVEAGAVGSVAEALTAGPALPDVSTAATA